MSYLAHSTKDTGLSQTYASHVEGVYERGIRYAKETEIYAAKTSGMLECVVGRSAVWHDLGKLDDENQAVLQEKSSNSHLPVNHVDAGAAVLIEQGHGHSALNVYSHHRGLPDMQTEWGKGKAIFRDEHSAVRKHVDEILEELVLRHQQEIQLPEKEKQEFYEGDLGIFYRMTLSCLADADHTDTALAYGQAPENESLPELRPKERLALLDQYVSEFEEKDERSKLRRKMYLDCRNSKQEGAFSSCDSPVGSGKTTAVMAHLLKQAADRKARRIFVVLPYTSIITQSVDVYRKALVLPGEDPEQVVAELHYRADFQDRDVRYLTSLWRAPIIVTTAVAFFETLASNKPSSLRRLHELPGSAIFIDESHASLPVKLLPIAWHWMNVLAKEWGCYWVLASGSLVRFWELDALQAIGIEHPKVSELVHGSLRRQLMLYEEERVAFCWNPDLLSRERLCEWVQNSPGPRLLILNTVQSAAVIANDLCQRYGRECVEHLSTALTANDRAKTIERVKTRLEEKADQNWTLVATSCVEAGVDFSFHTGFREVSSLLSLLQAAGRVNRHGCIPCAKMWSFAMQDSLMLKKNKGLKTSREILTDYFERQTVITPELSTHSMEEEIIRHDCCLEDMKAIRNEEESMQFITVAEQFRVVDSDTVTAVIDETLAAQIVQGKGDWKQLQKYAVSIRREKIKDWKLIEIAKGIYQWTLPYDSFLGYMDGVLNLERGRKDFLIL